MRILARRLIAAERRANDSEDTDGRAAFRVCERMRESLSPLTGRRGFSALVERALALAAVEVRWLGKVEWREGSSTLALERMPGGLSSDDAAKGGEVLVTHLLELLSTFIGEALTRRLVQQVWPKAALGEPKSGRKS